MSDSLKYWQDLACANRKVAEDAQTQRDKLAVALESICSLFIGCIENITYDEQEVIDSAASVLKECGK